MLCILILYRNVKWVSRITLSGEEAEGAWQRGMAYKGLPPSAKSLEGIDVEKVLRIVAIII